MPIAAYLTFSGELAPTADPPATFGGWLEDGREPEPTFGGTVDRSLVESLDAPAVVFGAQVLLDGEDVSADLVGEVSVERSIDQPFARAAFRLLGRRYLPTATEKTWTRTPVEVRFLHGPPGAVREAVELVGLVETCRVGPDGSVEVAAVDLGLRFAKTDVCFELEPLAGLRRGEIVRQLAEGVGIPKVDVPPGAVYAKPLQTQGRRLFEVLSAFGEPEGWKWRFEIDGALAAFVTSLRREPEPPDHVWHVADLDAHPALVPPTEVPSRWLVRASSAVFVDELGLATELTETRTHGLYTLREAVFRQQIDGSLAPVESAAEERFLPLSHVYDELTKRGDRPVRQVTTERGWYAPASGKHRTPQGSEAPGPIGEGYRYTTAWIDAEGRHLAWRQERWVEVGRRIQTWSYDAEGDLAELVVGTHRWHRRSAGVRRASGSLLVGGAAVADDDLSYEIFGHVGLAQVERYSLAEEQRVRYSHHPTTGALEREEQDAWRYLSPRASIDPPHDHWMLADGSAQADRFAAWRFAAQQTRDHQTDASGRLRGETTRTYGFAVTTAANGTFDWGEHRSNFREEVFRLLAQEEREIVVESQDVYIEIRYAEGERRETRHLGAPPLPRYLASPWTRLVQQPVEVALDDPTLERWFGFERRVIQHEFLQSTAEALAFLDRLLERELSHEVEVERPETLAEPGETVLLIDPERSLHHRALIVAVAKSRDLAQGRATGRYRLEVPLR